MSRITTAKYLQTDWGIFELKHFFSNAVAGPGAPRLAVLEGRREGDRARDRRERTGPEAVRPRRSWGRSPRRASPSPGGRWPSTGASSTSIRRTRGGAYDHRTSRGFTSRSASGPGTTSTRSCRGSPSPKDLVTDLLLAFSREKSLYKLEATVNFRWGTSTHIRVEGFELVEGIDALFDKLEPKIEKEKNKVQDHRKGAAVPPAEEP